MQGGRSRPPVIKGQQPTLTRQKCSAGSIPTARIAYQRARRRVRHGNSAWFQAARHSLLTATNVMEGVAAVFTTFVKWRFLTVVILLHSICSTFLIAKAASCPSVEREGREAHSGGHIERDGGEAQKRRTHAAVRRGISSHDILVL